MFHVKHRPGAGSFVQAGLFRAFLVQALAGLVARGKAPGITHDRTARFGAGFWACLDLMDSRSV